MDIDFHYDMMKVLAMKAGFEEPEAKIIAYACQYLDDANEHVPAKFKNIAELKAADSEVESLGMIGGGDKFLRVCTGHDDLQTVGGAGNKAQTHTYLPFHFIPTDTKDAPGTGHGYTTSPNCTIVRELMDQALEGLKSAAPDRRVKGLIRFGVALHSYIDSWAHQGFSGLFNRRDNAADRIALRGEDGGSPKPIDIDFFASAVPETGHAKVHRYPDCSHHYWTYRAVGRRTDVVRDNPAVYLDSARHAYDYLCRAAGSSKAESWDSISGRVDACIRYQPPSGWKSTDPLMAAVITEKRIKYIQVFPECGLGRLSLDGKPLAPTEFSRLDDAARSKLKLAAHDYDRHAWKDECYTVYNELGKVIAVNSSDLDVTSASVQHQQAWRGFVEEEPFSYRFKGDRKWLWFQIEAERQRRYVHSRITMPDAAADTTFLMKATRTVMDVADNTASLAGNLAEAGQEKLAKFLGRPELGVAKELEKKKAWIRVMVVNATPWLLEWSGDPVQDFTFADYNTQPLIDPSKENWRDGSVAAFGNFFKNLGKEVHNRIMDVGHGEYWPGLAPAAVKPDTFGEFGLSEKANAANTAGGVTLFTLKADGEDCSIAVAFSRPLGKSTRKIGIFGRDGRMESWKALTGWFERPTASRVKLKDGSVLRLIAQPSSRARVLVEVLDEEREKARGDLYRKRYPRVSKDIDDMRAANPQDRPYLHYLTSGQSLGYDWGDTGVDSELSLQYWAWCPDVASSPTYGRNGTCGSYGALSHYQEYGREEGERRPWGAKLRQLIAESEAYFQRNPDLAKEDDYNPEKRNGPYGPYLHWKKYGQNEGRRWGL